MASESSTSERLSEPTPNERTTNERGRAGFDRLEPIKPLARNVGRSLGHNIAARGAHEGAETGHAE